jgi:hypothetical protein
MLDKFIPEKPPELDPLFTFPVVGVLIEFARLEEEVLSYAGLIS